MEKVHYAKQGSTGSTIFTFLYKLQIKIFTNSLVAA